MNDEQLSRTLQSVGQACFVRFFGEFSSNTLSREDIVEKLRAETDYTEGSCISRTGRARSIINAGRAEAALNIITSSDSPRVSEKTRKDALQWIQKIIS